MRFCFGTMKMLFVSIGTMLLIPNEQKVETGFSEYGGWGKNASKIKPF